MVRSVRFGALWLGKRSRPTPLARLRNRDAFIVLSLEFFHDRSTAGEIEGERGLLVLYCATTEMELAMVVRADRDDILVGEGPRPQRRNLNDVMSLDVRRAIQLMKSNCWATKCITNLAPVPVGDFHLLANASSFDKTAKTLLH